MASPGEKEWRANDQVGAADSTMPDEPEKELPVETQMDAEKGVEADGNAVASSSSTSSAGDAYEADARKRNKWHKRLNPFQWGPRPDVPVQREVSREYGAGFWSMLTFNWMAPLMAVGYRRPLELNDIWLVNPDRSAEVLSARLMLSFRKRVARRDDKPLVGAMHDTFKTEFWVGGVCQLLASILQVISPFTLKYLISFATEAYMAQHGGYPGPSIAKGIGLVLGITAMQILQSLCTNHFLYRGMIVGGQARAVMISIIFDKALRLSGRAKAGGKAVEAPPADLEPGSEAERKWYRNMLKRKGVKNAGGHVANGIAGDGQGWSNGRIINLMSVDTYRIDQASGLFHLLWCSPVSIVITLVLLIINLGYSALAGFGLLVITFPLLGRAIKSLFKRRVTINKVTDQRVGLTQEILQAVRFVKYFGWETSFLERLDAIRNREIRMIQKVLSIRNAINAVGLSMPVFASMLSFITYSLSQHVLDPAPIFSSLGLFNALRLPLNLLPLVLGQVVDASSSVNRIQDFLLAEEVEDEVEWDHGMKDAVVVRRGDFTWERTPTQDPDKLPGGPRSHKQVKEEKNAKKEQDRVEKKAARETKKSSDGPPNDFNARDSSETLAEKAPFKIQGLDFSIGRNELVAVIGTVGSGKSSLLAALAGDMRRTAGEVKMGASRAFCPQYAWIQNATVKDNIVFGKPFRQDWYDAVVDACALRADFDMLPNGDLTEIGERGITVSGGQKQRLNIARAIYFDADIILMDDPLSAVDAHVGRHIMDNAICGLLRNKSRILATHQLHVLNRCDRIILMQDGRIETVDTYDKLMAHNPDFIKLMASTAVEDDKEKKDQDEIQEEKKDVVKRVGGKKPAAGLMQAEERAVKSVSFGVYAAYIKAAGSWLIAPVVVGMLILSQGANIATSLWLSWWTSNKFGFSTGAYIGVYAALGFVQALLIFLFSVGLSVFGTKAGKVMLRQAITRVLRAPMSFFDTTPLGRITNRFSRDIDTMDNTLTDSMRMFMLTMAMIISVFALIIAYFHYFAIALGPLFVMFLFSASYYRASAREVKRHEAVLRSVVFSRFGEAVTGTATVRAYGLEHQFSRSIRDAVDTMDSAYYLTFANQRWLSVRLDSIGNLLVFTTGILVVTSRFDVSPSIAGLVLSYILSIVQMIQFSVRQLAEVENNMNATERIHYYGTSLATEARLDTPAPGLPPSWPSHGAITFTNASMRYRPSLPLVLRNLNLSIRGGERVGVVGRTGAGKSSIMSTLFRLVELDAGRIEIDGVDISSVGLRDLRSRLAIIPQDPTLFRGTVRSNLDPFAQHSDLELWDALRQADLVPKDGGAASTAGAGAGGAGTGLTLDTPTEEEGLNFSLGQRQLLALARALVRRARIIVCDEATSSVDLETDALIQEAMKKGFRDATVLCIAHRLRTIVGYDRVVVLEGGEVVELGRPRELWVRGGVFRGMCERGGVRGEDFGREEGGEVREGGV